MENWKKKKTEYGAAWDKREVILSDGVDIDDVVKQIMSDNNPDTGETDIDTGDGNVSPPVEPTEPVEPVEPANPVEPEIPIKEDEVEDTPIEIPEFIE